MRSKNAAKNIMSSLLLQGATIVCGFIVPKLIIDSFGSATNGLVNSIAQFLAYISLLESGFGPVVKSVLYKPIASKDKKTIERILKTAEKFFRNIAKIFVLYIIILCFVFPLLADKDFSTWYTVSLVIIIALGTFSEYFFGITYKLYLQAEQKTYVTAYIQMSATILSAVATIVLIKFGASIQAVKLAVAAIFVLRPIIQNYYVKKKYHLNLREAEPGYKIKQKWDGLAQHIAATVHGNTDITVITLFSTLQEVSVYSVYMLVVKGVKSVVEAFNQGIDASFGDMIAKGEHEVLNKKFSAYELFFHTVSTILFICTMVLITPFVSIYTTGVTDADYVRPVFGMLIAASEFIWAIRLPYSSVVLAAGHFKETRKGAWVEAILNIAISVILVFNFGIIGVAIGTIVAMAVRTIEFMYHNSKYILKRPQIQSFSWLFVIALETIISLIFCNAFVHSGADSFIGWIGDALLTVCIVAPVVVAINAIAYRSHLKEVSLTVKKLIKKGVK